MALPEVDLDRFALNRFVQHLRERKLALIDHPVIVVARTAGQNAHTQSRRQTIEYFPDRTVAADRIDDRFRIRFDFRRQLLSLSGVFGQPDFAVQMILFDFFLNRGRGPLPVPFAGSRIHDEYMLHKYPYLKIR